MRRIARLFAWGAFVALAVAAPGALRHSALRFNYSDSVPVGLYRSQPEPNAPFAGICLNSNTLRSAFDAGLKLAAGECPDGHQPILKTVYRATPESPIVLDSRASDRRRADGKYRHRRHFQKRVSHWPIMRSVFTHLACGRFQVIAATVSTLGISDPYRVKMFGFTRNHFGGASMAIEKARFLGYDPAGRRGISGLVVSIGCSEELGRGHILSSIG